MTSVSCSLTSYLKQYGNQLILSTMWHNLLLFWCHDIGLLLLCSLVQIKLTLILKATELVVFVTIVISENFAIFCVTLVVLLTLCRLCMCHLLITFANSLDPDQAWKMSGLIWIQTIWNSYGIPEIIFQKSWFWKKSADDKKHAKLPGMPFFILMDFAIHIDTKSMKLLLLYLNS